jgi:hypothetical protein
MVPSRGLGLLTLPSDVQRSTILAGPRSSHRARCLRLVEDDVRRPPSARLRHLAVSSDACAEVGHAVGDTEHRLRDARNVALNPASVNVERPRAVREDVRGDGAVEGLAGDDDRLEGGLSAVPQPCQVAASDV